jgi:hypothetical protein
MKQLILKSDDVSPELFQEAINAITTSQKVKHVQMDIQVEPDHYAVCDMDWIKHIQQVEVLAEKKNSVNEYCQHLNNAANLESIESRYKDLLNHLGVQGHCGAVSEIQALRKSADLDKSNEEKNKEIFTCIPLDSNNRMLRLGFGKNKGKWFIRVDLWYMGFRLVLN